MRNMFRTIREKLPSGEDLVLVTIIASSGSTPRGAGARMLVGAEGRLCGTIGGGNVEYRSEKIASDVLKEKKSSEIEFRLTKDDVQNLGMICGGDVDVFFKFINANDSEVIGICDCAEESFAKGKDMWIVSDISDDGNFGLYVRGTGFVGIDCPRDLLSAFSRHPSRTIVDGSDYYTEQINSSGRVYIFGCGHVAQELVPVLSHVGFRCVALDDRPEFASKELFPDAEDVKLIDFEDIAATVSITEEDYVCVMTRGHAYDTVVQAQVLRTDAYYIGVIGSAKKKAGVYQKLMDEYGFESKDFERITSPIGMYIKAETPAEIAISIAGQMIEKRAERNAQ